MADNGQNNPFNSGDILNSLTNDVTLIRQDTSDIKDDTFYLKDIDRNVADILKHCDKWSQQSAHNRIYDTVENNSRNGNRSDERGGAYNRRYGNNRDRDRDTRNSRSPFGGRGKDDTKGFVDSFFSELQKEALGADFKGTVQQSMRDFASALGVEVRDIPGLFGKTLAKSFSQSDLGKQVISRFRDVAQNTVDRMFNGASKFTTMYLGRKVSKGNMTQDQAIDQFKQFSDLYQNAWGKITDSIQHIDHGPDINTTQGNNTNSDTVPDVVQSDEPEYDFSMVLDDKLQYLYPIYNSVSDIQQWVKELANVWMEDGIRKDVMNQTSEQMSKENDIFLNSLLYEQNRSHSLKDVASKGMSQFMEGGGADTLMTLGTQLMTPGATVDAAAALSGFAGALSSVSLPLLAVEAGMVLLDKAVKKFQKCFEPLQEAWKNFTQELDKVTNRYFESQKQKIEARTKRLNDDVEVMIRKPFEIMEKAADDWYNAWDNNLRTINATQGYTKADLQDLMASYAERLRSEGLDSAVSAADMTENLSKVLEAGLQGAAAEEFAYLATVLEAAVPTQDFFGYADTYASIAVNAMLAGKSPEEAIASANAQLKQFASNLLYSSRELAGGFASGLKDASSLLDDAVKIANTAGISDSSAISSALTAVAGTVGAIAPDLASNITDAIVEAALGGNSDELVALRSLANTGASNTAFLNAFANDPQRVLQNLFNNLANMQQLNKDNFMEVAESLSSTFGVTAGAFSRINFYDISQAISNMNSSMGSLEDNMQILEDGQTTTTMESLKMQEINKMILDEGLSYVLDNEAARSIQEHMWEQEIAEQIMEAEYGVNLQGAALELLSGIQETINNILNFLNPFSWMKKIVDLIETGAESAALQVDIERMLEAGKVGSGNKESLYNLTTYDVDKLTNKPGNLAQMMTGSSLYSTLSSIGSLYRSSKTFGGKLNGLLDLSSKASLWGDLYTSSARSEDYESQYSWGNFDYVTKGVSNAIQATPMGTGAYVIGSSSNDSSEETAQEIANSLSAQESIATKNTANIQDYLNTMQQYVEDNKSYAEWEASASDYNIRDLSAAIEQYGLTVTDLKNKYQEYESSKGSEYNYNKDQQETSYYDRAKQFMDTDYPAAHVETLERLDSTVELLTNLDATLTSFFESWTVDWLVGAWTEGWLQEAWQNNWVDTAWREEFLNQAFRQEWLQDAWQGAWLDNAWNTEWLDKAWRQEWLNEAWQNSWLTEAWGSSWLQKAWNEDWLNQAWREEWINQAWFNGWLESWKKDWLETAWTENWVNQSWKQDWLNQSWNTDWLEQAWKTDWLDNAWQSNWLEDNWQKRWLTEAWNNDWLTDAWQNSWLNEAWGENWLTKAWGTDWLQTAWATNWLSKAWQKNWLDTSWQKHWLDNAWQKNWLDTEWHKNWLDTAWKVDWINNAWKKDWLTDEWGTNWINNQWKSEWLTNQWGNEWLDKAWRHKWIETAWEDKWIDKAWDKRFIKETFKEAFIRDTIKVWWNNLWFEFFNIFNDRWGGISTSDVSSSKEGESGSIGKVNTEGLYQIYTKETGKAAAKALEEVKNSESKQTGDAILALAKQLTKNSVDLADPQVQTNALLSQILIVLEAIMQAENVSGGASLATTLAALGMGSTLPNTSENAGTSKSGQTAQTV